MATVSEYAGLYGSTFYEAIEADTVRTARVIIPRVLDLARPTSVVDVGCGTGGWLATFQQLGVDDVLGVDGSWVDRSQLLVSEDRFVARDLTRALDLDRRFDLAISLEVAEHVPPYAADRFVESLTSLADTVLFSAAPPGQGGVDHVNEQWPEYWVRRFGDRAFVAVDCIRWEHWRDSRVAAFYVQNMFLAIQENAIQRRPALADWMDRHPDRVGDIPGVVHPSLRVPGGLTGLARALQPIDDHYSAQDLARALARRSRRAIHAQLGRGSSRHGDR